MSYEFQSGLYHSGREVAGAIASAWLHAGGSNSDAFVREILAEYSDAQLAAECIEGWDLLEIQNEDDVKHDNATPVTWLESREVTPEMLERAFGVERTEALSS